MSITIQSGIVAVFFHGNRLLQNTILEEYRYSLINSFLTREICGFLVMTPSVFSYDVCGFFWVLWIFIMNKI